MNWYVLQTKPCLEDQVRMKLEKAAFEVFLPKIKSLVRGYKRPIQRVKPLFPSYLFAHLDFEEADVFHKIKYTRGVRKIVGAGDIPLPVADAVVDIIRGRMSDENIIEQQFRLKEGDAVRIVHGPLSDLIGILEKPVSAAGRVRVLLSLIGKKVRMELPCVQVEKVCSYEAA